MEKQIPFVTGYNNAYLILFIGNKTEKITVAQLKADNPNTYGIPAEEDDQEHYSKVSVVLADSVVPDF